MVWLLVCTGFTNDKRAIYALASGSLFPSIEEATAYATRNNYKVFIFASTLTGKENAMNYNTCQNNTSK